MKTTQQNVPSVALDESAGTKNQQLARACSGSPVVRNVAFPAFTRKDDTMSGAIRAASGSRVIEMPVAKPHRAKRTAARNSMSHLTPDELLALLRTARQANVRDWAMILMAYRHGLRASEVCGLSLDDLDVKNRAVTLRRLKGSMRTVQPLYEHRGQPLLDEVVALRQWLKQRRDDGSKYVFTSQKGGRLDRTQFFRLFQGHAEAAGLPVEKRHPHVLKHSLGTHLVSGNVNLALVKQALGHRSINSTMKYIGTTDGQAAAAVRSAMADLF
jgi:type 1 fimbriae regulatory protein FimB